MCMSQDAAAARASEGSDDDVWGDGADSHDGDNAAGPSGHGELHRESQAREKAFHTVRAAG
jgi:hypothetical protein